MILQKQIEGIRKVDLREDIAEKANLKFSTNFAMLCIESRAFRIELCVYRH